MEPLGKFKLALRRMISPYTSVIPTDTLGVHSVFLLSFYRRSAEYDGSASRMSTLANSYVGASFCLISHAREKKRVAY